MVGMVLGASIGAVVCGVAAFFSEDIEHFFEWFTLLLRFHL